MQNITYSNFRSHLAKVLDQVNDSHASMLITRRSGKPAVVMSLEDFKSCEETGHLMSSMNNASRLNIADRTVPFSLLGSVNIFTGSN